MSFFDDVTQASNALTVIQKNFEKVELASEGFEHVQANPAQVWGPFNHGLGHVPSSVSVWVGGRLTGCQVEATSTTVTVTFNTNESGIMRCR